MWATMRSGWKDLLRHRWARILVATAVSWRQDRVSRLAAALSYYTLLSLAPLLILTVALASLLFDREIVIGYLHDHVATTIGDSSAATMQAMMERRPSANVSTLTAVVSILVTLWGAAGVFLELKDSLNTIWKVSAARDRTMLELVKSYFAPLSMVLGIGFLLLVSLVLSAAVSMLIKQLAVWQPGFAAMVGLADLVISWLMTTVLFAAIYRWLPDVTVPWRCIWWGAIVASSLFTIGRFAIGFYLGTTDFAGHYGPLGAAVAIVAWVYYSAQILFIGAGFTRAYVFERHSQVVASHGNTLAAAG